MKEIIQTSFVKGVHRDLKPRFQPDGTYRHALNKKKASDQFYTGGLTNELQNKLAASIPGTIVGYYRIEEENSTLFFHIDGGSTISLFNHDTNEVKKIVTDSDFGCTWNFKSCKWMGYGHVDSKSIAPCNELIVYFSSGNTYYKVNIHELQDEKRRESIKLLENVCDYFKLMKEISGPRMKIRTNRGGGRDLVPGQYYTVARALDESGNSSNWGVIEGPAYIGSKYNKFTDTSKQSLQIEAKFLSKEYSRIQIAVIPPIGSAAQDVAYVIYDGSYNTNGVSTQYYSTAQHKAAIPLAEILTKGIKFLRGSNLIADGGKLHLYKTLQEFNPKVQEWASKIKIYPIAFAVPQSEAHKYKSFSRDEVYAFGAEWQYTDQTWTATGHIPGNQGGANELTCGTCDLPPGHTSNNASLLEKYAEITGEKEKVGGTGGQQTTTNEGYDPKPLGDGSSPDQPVEVRADDGDQCVEHVTEKEALETKIEAIQTRSESLDDCIDCASATTKADLKQNELGFVNFLEQATDLLKTDKEVSDDCTTGDHTTIPGAAKTLYDEGIRHAEKDEEVSYRTVLTPSGGKNAEVKTLNSNEAKRPPEVGEQNTSILIFGTAKGEDCVTDSVEPIVLAKYQMGGWESTFTYPKTLDCDGKPLYGDLAGLPIRHHKFPDASLVPLFYSFQRGVESRHDPSNIPGKDTYVVLLGIQVESVYTPSYEKGEVPKPLDKNNPWRIVMAKRERHNQSVIYRGYFTNTFKGKIGNKEYAVPRHAANAYPNVDRSILTEDGSHMGEDWSEPLYVFHSPDLGTATEFINGDYVKIDAEITGDGMVYGLYDEGKDVKDEEHRLDRRGARSAMNFTSWKTRKFQTCLKGAEFAEHNTNLQNPQGISRPLLNKYRESSIYLETEERLPEVGETNKDKSFNVGGLDHEYITKGIVLYGSIKRFNSQQYGNVESLQYVDIGAAGKSGDTGLRIMTGDVFVQKWSNKRTSYISDKVGNFLNVDFPVTQSEDYLGPNKAQGGRDRGVCDPPNRRGYRMKEFLGFWNELDLPQNGDKKDPKNMANGHPIKTAYDIWGPLASGSTTREAETDIWYPRTLSQLNHLIAESDVNLYYRSTSEPETREIFYENLQGVEVDSSINNVDPEDAWLPDWHNQHKQPTKKQLEKRAKIRFALVIGGPAVFGMSLAAISTALQAGTTMLISPFFGVMWMLLVYNVLTVKKLNKLLGFPLCKTDDEGAQAEDNTKGLKDNWVSYNWGFSAVNDLNFFIGMPAVYNTCKCDDEFTNVIYSSNRQIDTSPYDAWSNFQALSYTAIAGDSGQLEKLFIWGNGLYAQTTDGLYQLQHKNPSIQTSGGELLLGSSEFIPNPTRMLNGVFEGFGGTSDPNAAITCRLGHISIDYEAMEITIFNGQFESIINKNSGLFHYWKDSFTFCNSGDRDQMCPDGVHYSLGYDPEYELLMITKHDGVSGFTWSYDTVSKMYISEHSYVPEFYFWDRNKLFSVKGNEIYRHNVPGAYSTYYGKKYPSSVDAVAHTKSSETFRYGYTVLDTEVVELDKTGLPGVFDRDETYNRLTAWNEFQTTGEWPIVNEDQLNALESTKDKPQFKISRRELGKWKLNNFFSNELNRDVPVVTIPGCGKVEVPNKDNLDMSPQIQKAKTIKGKYLIQRFQFDKNDRQIIFFGMNTHVETPEEK